MPISLAEVTPYPTMGGVFPIRNGITVKYPFVESIVSALPLLDKLVIVDGGSNDGTLEVLTELAHTYDTISLYRRDELKATEHHDVIDDQLLFGVDQLDTDWLFEIQADEMWDPNRLPAVAELINHAYNADAKSIRLWRTNANFHNEWGLVTVRILENHPDLGSASGGDCFYLTSEVPEDATYPDKTYKDYTKHDVQPEYQSEMIFWHIKNYRDKDAHLARHAKWLSTNNRCRKDAFQSHVGDDQNANEILNLPDTDGSEKYGTPEIIVSGTPKSSLIPSSSSPMGFSRLSQGITTDTNKSTVIDRNGKEYRHGFHKDYPNGDMEIRNGDVEPVDTTELDLGLPYEQQRRPTYDPDSIYFHPTEMENATQLPYTLLSTN